MKNSALIIAILSLAISACTTQKQATSSASDDVYYSGSGNSQPVGNATKSTSTAPQVITSPDNATIKKPASSSFEDDYNDYSYSSRMNRFSSKDTTKGYFDDTYASGGSNTVSSEPDVNFYLGVGSGYGGYYGSSFSYGMGWGSPYYGWDYGWGYPYYGWGYPYYGWGYPYYGYNPWYSNCCYCYGYNEWYGGYPPYYSSSSYYYGARSALYKNEGGRNTNARTTPDASYSAEKRGTGATTTPSYSRSGVQPTPRGVPASQEQYRYTRTEKTQQAGYNRSTKSNQVQAQRKQPTPRYVKPENAPPAQRSGSAQSYSSPVYRQPKSSKEYLTPRSQNPGATRVSTQNTGSRYTPGSGTRQNPSSTNSTRTFTAPSKSGSSGYSSPPRSNSTYSSPPRSGNSGSNSAPSNSNGGGSYSAPSRSGGNSSGSPSGSGGSSSGGGRRR